MSEKEDQGEEHGRDVHHEEERHEGVDPYELGMVRNWVGRFIDDPRFLFPDRAFGQETAEGDGFAGRHRDDGDGPDGRGERGGPSSGPGGGRWDRDGQRGAEAGDEDGGDDHTGTVQNSHMGDAHGTGHTESSPFDIHDRRELIHKANEEFAEEAMTAIRHVPGMEFGHEHTRGRGDHQVHEADAGDASGKEPARRRQARRGDLR